MLLDTFRCLIVRRNAILIDFKIVCKKIEQLCNLRTPSSEITGSVSLVTMQKLRVNNKILRIINNSEWQMDQSQRPVC